jgi:type II pantothenate kinase
LASPSQTLRFAEQTPGIPGVGADVGATLVKLAIRDATGHTALETFPAQTLDEAARRVTAARPQRIGLTGGGAAQLARLLGTDAVRVNEFAAWGQGAQRMLQSQGLDSRRFLLVSVGTGTSAMLVEPGGVSRLGGTALGGGTVTGLGAALLGTSDFDEIANLARHGDRRQVDLLVRDIYPDGDFTLPGDINAASFAKLAGSQSGVPPQHRDLAHGVMGLVGENVALICCGLAAAAQVSRIVFGGGTLQRNPALVDILRGVCAMLGREPVFLDRGEFAGAVGALETA